MNDTTNNSDGRMTESVLARIKAGEVKMHSRGRYILSVAAVAALVFAILVVSVFLSSFILFNMRMTGQSFLLGFGMKGLLSFFVFFPWGLLLVDIALLAILEKILRRFRFCYKMPVIYMFAAVAVVTLLSGLVLDRSTPFHDDLLRRSDKRKLPLPLGSMYGGMRLPLPPKGDSICRCLITSIDGNVLTVRRNISKDVIRDLFRDATSSTPLEKEFTVVLPEMMKEDALRLIEVGDTVFIAGSIEEGSIRAFGIRKEAGKEMR